MIKSSISLSGKIAVFIVLALLGLFLLRATGAPSTLSGGGTMQGAGADATAPTALGICGTINNVGLQITLASIVSGIKVSDLTNAMFDGAVFTVVGTICSFYSSTIQFLENRDFILGTGQDITYGQPIVQQLWQAMLVVAGFALVLMWLFTGMNVMRGESVSNSVPRLVLATVLAFGAYPIAARIIDLESLMCGQVLVSTNLVPSGVPIASGGIDLASLFLGGATLTNLSDLATTLPALLVLVESVAVGFEMLVRVAGIDLLLVCSPVLIFYGLPQWQKWANLWVMAFLGLVFVQFLQVVAICLGSALTKFFGGSTIIALFVGIAMMYLVLKIPSWFGGLVSSTLTGVSTPYAVAGKAIEAAAGAAKAAIGAMK